MTEEEYANRYADYVFDPVINCDCPACLNPAIHIDNTLSKEQGWEPIEIPTIPAILRKMKLDRIFKI
jgi:hypothetical protein